MDPDKTKAVAKWPTPNNPKGLKRFFGFTIFLSAFCNYSSIAVPFTALTSSKVAFCWTSATEEAFRNLKKHLSSALVLVMPNPDKQFIIEVDASVTGVGAVLSQRTSDNKVHPCAFFIRLHGLLLEVTSDRGSQFTSQFWKAFCELIGVKPQLASQFHPQTND